MKASLVLSVLIVVAGLMYGSKQQRLLTKVREVHAQVRAEADELGISAAAGGEEPGMAPRIAEREREERESEARAMAAKVIAFAKEMEEYERRGEQPDEEMQKRIMEIMGLFLDMDAVQLKVVIAELKASDEIKDEMRRGIVGFSIMMLSAEHPEAALALFAETSDLMEDNGMGDQVIATALGKWAAEDPMAALEWIRANSEKHSEMVTDDAKAAVIAGAAKQDLKLALSLIGELGLKDDGKVASSLVRGAATDGQRTELLALLREQKESRGGLLESALSMMASEISREGFGSSREWVEAVELSEQETDSFVDGLSYHQTRDDTGKWIEWVGGTTGERNLNEVGNLMREWTRNDYKAAGTWLNGAAAGPTKTAAVVSYASMVAEYEPDSAAQWARTLPKGEERSQLMETIRDQWREKDPTAAEAFAAEEGIMWYEEPE